MARQRKTATERRQEILTNAFELFKQNGYNQVTMEHIAKSCRIARTSLYEYFASKEQILLQLASRIADELHAFVPVGESCRTRIEHLTVEYLTRIQRNRDLYRILFQQAPVLSQEVSNQLVQWQQELFLKVVQLAEEGKALGEIRAEMEKKDVAFLFQAIVGQRAGQMLMQDEPIDCSTEGAYLIRLMWSGIGS